MSRSLLGVLALLVTAYPAAAADRDQVLAHLAGIKAQLDCAYRPLRIFFVMGIKAAKLGENGDKKLGNSNGSPNELIAQFVGMYDDLETTRTLVDRLKVTIETKKDLNQSDLDEIEQRLTEFQQKIPEINKVLDFVMDLVDGIAKQES